MRFWTSFVNVMAPPQCVGCRLRLEEAVAPLCDSCLAALPCHEPAALPGGTPSIRAAYAAFRYTTPLPEALHAMKYRSRERLTGWFAQHLAVFARHAVASDAIDCIVPVPLHPSRLRQRGFNQAEILARGVAQHLARPMEVAAVRRRRATPPQARLAARRRWQNVADAFEPCRPSPIAGRRCLLVDDMTTTGATAESCGRVLRQAGATDVLLLTLARGG